MKKAGKIVFAVALIAAGILWALSILDVLPFEFSTKGWWALFVIVPCICGLFTDQNKVGPCIGIVVGVLLLLAARDVITWNMMWQLAVALCIIGFGVQLLLFKGCGCGCCHKEVCELETISRDGKDIRRIESSFGKQSISFGGQKFQGADVESSFGGLTLDLSGAQIEDGAFVNLNVGFSGVSIIVPEGQAVKLAVNSGFGGVSDRRYSKVENGNPLLIITGKVGFGGVEIRN